MNYEHQSITFADLNFDLTPEEVPDNAVTGAGNIRYDDGKYRRCPGYTPALGTPPHDPRFLFGFPWQGQFHWLSCGTTQVYDIVAQVPTEVTNIGGMNTTEQWTADYLNGIPVLSTPDIVPQFLNLSINSKLQDLTGWDTSHRATVIRSYKNFLVALDITKAGENYSNMVKWSDTADAGEVPQSWDITDPTKQAGETVIASTPGRLIDACKLRDALILYKYNSCVTMQWVGGNNVFSFRKLFHNIGVMGKNCVAEFNGNHLVLTPDDVVVHDGNSARSIIDKRMRRWMFGKINRDAMLANFVVEQHLKDEIWICFATGSSLKPSVALIWNYEEDAFSVQDLPQADHIAVGDIIESDINATPPMFNVTDDPDITWDGEIKLIWNTNNTDSTALRIVMTANNQHYLMDYGDLFDTQEIEAYLEKTGMVFGDIERMKYMNRVVPFLTGNSLVEINMGGQLFNNEGITWGTPVSFDITRDRRANFIIKGKLGSFRLSSKREETWELAGVSVEYKLADRY